MRIMITYHTAFSVQAPGSPARFHCVYKGVEAEPSRPAVEELRRVVTGLREHLEEAPGADERELGSGQG